MTLGIKLLKLINPGLEDKRMELRRAILQAEACAEDLSRTVRTYRKRHTKYALRSNMKDKA